MDRPDLLARVRAVDDELLDDVERAPRTVDELLLDLVAAEPSVRAAAASALGRVADPSTTKALRAAAGDAVPAVRAAALAALVRLAPDTLLPEIVKSLRSDDARVVAGAAVVLGRAALLGTTGSSPAGPAEKGARVVGAPTRRAGSDGTARSALPNLVEAFKTDDAEIGRAVAWALGCMADRAVVPWLVAALEQGFVPRAAAAALGRLGDARAQPALLAALGDDDDHVRAAAARALGRLADAPIARLELMLGDPSARVRLCAALALYEQGEDAGPLSRALDEQP